MVSAMYSVIIQNQRSMDEFSKFQPLFMEAVNNDRIGICKWIESGNTVDTAIPEIYNLTNDKEEWRAIIVRFEDESNRMGFDSDLRNPYDFLSNHGKEETFGESDIPIIRLAQILGGIPTPEMKFERLQVQEKNRASHVVYRPVTDEKNEKEYELLKRKYKYDGKRPSSVVIITVRENYTPEEDFENAWTSHKESASSDFWKVNRYPSMCRFLVCDFKEGGPVQREGDEFNFWLSVLMIAINEPDSSTLQAYRLYNLKTVIDKEQMTETFQQLVYKLKSSRYVIEEKIKREANDDVDINPELPKYRMDIPVAIKQPKDVDVRVKRRTFGLFSEGATTDIGIWSSQKKRAEKLLEESIRNAERTLDQTAIRMKEFLTFEEDEVAGLTKYQKEDMIRETDEIYDDLIRTQGKLPKTNLSNDENINKSAEEVRKYLLGRIVGKHAVVALIITIILIILSMMPSLYIASETGKVSLVCLSVILSAVILIILVFAFGTLLFQKSKLNRLIRGYNQNMKAAFNKLTDNAKEYSRYLSDIISHSRGYSYLNLSERKKHYEESNRTLKYKHIKAINMFLEKIRRWSKAYYLKVDFESNHIDERTTVDISILPTESRLYTFEFGSSYPVEVNNSGTYIDSPFAFVTKLKIIREELYDDSNN